MHYLTRNRTDRASLLSDRFLSPSRSFLAARVLLTQNGPVSSPLIPTSSIIAVVLSAATGFAQPPTAPEPKVFEVVARRFAFEPATVEVTEGDTVRLVVRSADGPHGVEIKAFKVKKAVPRAKPGDAPITIEFVAATAGEFPILCSEYCGNKHNDMTGTLVVRAKPKGNQ
jgi:cytochrome c oxidase subunit II